MDTYNINDENFKSSSLYQNFIERNPSQGSLKIRAFAASQAIPIQGLNAVISTVFDDKKIIFFEGTTNESGVIDGIILPTPKLDPNNLDVPLTTTYNISVTYEPDNVNAIYKVNMYEDICVVQNINIVPELKRAVGGIYGR